METISSNAKNFKYKMKYFFFTLSFLLSIVCLSQNNCKQSIRKLKKVEKYILKGQEQDGFNLLSKIDKSIYRIKEGVRFSSIEIPKGSFPDNLIRYRSKQKSEIRRIKKKNKNFQYRSYSVKDMSFPKDKIINLRDRIISSRIRTEDFLDNNLINLIEEMYNNSDLVISEVFELDSSSNINSLAICFILVQKDDYQFWIDLFIDKTMINLYNYIKFIELVSLDKDVSVNFGRGDYRYKLSNFQSDIAQLYSFNTYSSSIDLLFRYYILDTIRDIARKIYYKIK